LEQHGGALLDRAHAAPLEQARARRLGRPGEAQRVVERVEMTGLGEPVAAEIARRAHHGVELLAAQEPPAGVAVTLLEMARGLLERTHLARLGCGQEIAGELEIAVDGKAAHALAQEFDRLEAQGPQAPGILAAHGALDGLHLGGVAPGHVPAVAARGTEAHARGFEQHHVVAAACELERGREPGVAAAHHGDVAGEALLELGQLGRGMGARRVIGAGMGRLRHRRPRAG